MRPWEILRLKRKQKELSQKELANQLSGKLSPDAIRKWEKGENAIPPIYFSELCGLLDMFVSQLMPMDNYTIEIGEKYEKQTTLNNKINFWKNVRKTNKKEEIARAILDLEYEKRYKKADYASLANADILMLFRKYYGLTQKELADFLWMSPSTIQKYEQGEIQISLENMQAFANVFGLCEACFVPYATDIHTLDSNGIFYTFNHWVTAEKMVDILVHDFFFMRIQNAEIRRYIIERGILNYEFHPNNHTLIRGGCLRDIAGDKTEYHLIKYFLFKHPDATHDDAINDFILRTDNEENSNKLKQTIKMLYKNNKEDY